MTLESPAAPAVQVVIVAWNSGEHLQRALDALAAQTFRDFEVVVWDNASADGAVDRLRLPGNARLVRSAENLGFAAGNNRAVALSRSHWIAALNPDAFPEPGWLQALVGAAEQYGAASAASLQLDDADPDVLDGAGDVFSVAGFAWRGGFGGRREEAPQAIVEVFAACGAAALYRRDAFEAVGGFDERYFCYFEDVDLGARLRARGGRTVFVPQAVVRHVGSASTRSVSGFAEYHGTRNSFWTAVKVMPRFLLPVTIPSWLLVMGWILLRTPDPAIRRERLRALGDARRGVRPFLRDRPLWRPVRPLEFVRALSWSPFALRERRPVWRTAFLPDGSGGRR
ncbi:MAG TPA: glycosyltransferase family 2 protein [Caulobacteraceae bacterium]|jgi:GT2 family glycosyltransferase